MPPCPTRAVISSGPSFVPGESGIQVNQLSLTHPVADRSWIEAHPEVDGLPESVFPVTPYCSPAPVQLTESGLLVQWRAHRPLRGRYRQISVATRPAKDPRPAPHARRRVEAYSAAAFAAFLVFDQTVRQAFRRPSDVAATVLPGAGARRPGGHASWCSFPHEDLGPVTPESDQFPSGA
jgi:hypothetical protein